MSESIHWKNESAEMVGIIPAKAKMSQKPQGRGYVRLEETDDMPWDKISENMESVKDKNNTIDLTLKATSKPASKIINCHEFHYSSLQYINDDLNVKGKFAYKVHRGVGITGDHDGWVYKNLVATYSHSRHTNKNQWVNRFVEFVRSKVNTNEYITNKTVNISEV